MDFCEEDGCETRLSEDRVTKELHFKEKEGDEGIDMVVDSSPVRSLSSNDKLLERGATGSQDSSGVPDRDLRRASTFWKEILRDLWLMRFCRLNFPIGYNKCWKRLWVVFGQYLTVQPWTPDFNPFQLYPSVVMTWIRLLGLPGFLYKRKIFEEIGGLVGRGAKLVYNTDNKSRGRFARMTGFVNLD
ncbi:hypothetical protein J1N35_038136 [Gossypium stocksii]|uniref:DUF4283 domain-containing protein n=1 Tax=Gossypium stocksii TaxID=47602 RepID=A0A9D3ULB0_9ROSI|nr:hypothetical protein J1N35_038136 [Gossypium stocksii]